MAVDIDTRFTLIPNPNGNGDQLWWDYDELGDTPLERVWTVVEGEEAETCACPGFDMERYEADDPAMTDDFCHDADCEWHFPPLCPSPGYHVVNRLYYLVTKEPWTDADANVDWRF